MRILIHNMKDTNLSREHFRNRFEQILNSYPHTISLFKKTELEEIFKELFSLWVTLSQTHEMDFVKIKMGDILLNRGLSPWGSGLKYCISFSWKKYRVGLQDCDS